MVSSALLATAKKQSEIMKGEGDGQRNKIFADAQARKQKANMMQNAYLTDNMVAATDSDITGSKGNYDANTGIFRPDDKVVAGTTGSASYGTELQNFMAQIQTDAPKIEIEKIEVASIVQILHPVFHNIKMGMRLFMMIMMQIIRWIIIKSRRR